MDSAAQPRHPTAPSGPEVRRGRPPTGTNGVPVVERLLTVADLAEILGAGTPYIYRLVSERRVPYLKVGHYVRFDPTDIAAWLARAKVPPARRATPAEWHVRGTRPPSRRR